jgi:hypothetical protein
LPLCVTVIDCAVDPFDHVLPEVLDEVSVTDPPEQKVVGPLAEIVGAVGAAFTVTVSGLDVAKHDPLETLTV